MHTFFPLPQPPSIPNSILLTRRRVSERGEFEMSEKALSAKKRMLSKNCHPKTSGGRGGSPLITPSIGDVRPGSRVVLVSIVIVISAWFDRRSIVVCHVQRYHPTPPASTHHGREVGVVVAFFLIF